MLFNAINENDESDMSQVVPPSSSYHHHPPRVGEGELTFSLADSFLPVTYDVNGTYTENWLQSPSAGTSWSFQPESAYESDTFVPPPRHNPQQQQSQQQQQQQQLREEPILYTQPARQQYPQYEQYDSGPSVFVARNQHPRASSSASSSAQGISSHGSNYQFQTPVTQQRHPSFQTIPSPPLTQTQNLSHNQYDQPACQSINAAAWATTYSTDYDESVPGTRMPSHTSPPQATFKQILPQFVDESKNLYATGTKRAELQTPEPAKKRSRLVTPEPDINEFVVVFETAPGALANVKRRRKLDAPVRKAAKEVRKAGACHQCRFRRRTCSTGTPCGSCLKNGNGLHEIKCQRESPFVGKMMHQYFEHSSKRRVVSFNLRAGQLNPGADAIKHTVTIDGVGRLSHPVDIPALSQLFGSFSLDEKDTIKQTKELKPAEAADKDIDAESVLILEDGFAVALEQWAIEYSSKFVHAAGPEFYSTTMAQILGTAYVKKGLPESELVAAMLRMASLAFVLRAGVKYSYKGSTQCQFRTVQATVDTILFQRLRLAEKDLFQMLQRLIFRSAGSLTRDQIYPVALVLWQLLRILSIASSHLLNISQRFQSSAASKPADYQLFGLKLVISTHLALFRSSNPLLLDMNDKFNQDLLQNDEELIKLAVEMRKVVVNFKDKGFPEMKGSIAYRKDIFDQFRQVYSGK